MYSLILFGPIFIFLLSCVFGRWMGSYHTALAVTISTAASALLAVDGMITAVYHSFSFTYYLPIYTLVDFSWIFIKWHFYFDQLTISMFCLITIVSFFIQLFSISYIGEDASHVRFIIYLCFFMIAMLLLVGSTNFLQLFFGWELVGLASFLLINFWFARQDANAAAFKAIAVNRVGDCFLLLSIFLFAYEYNTFDFDIIFILSDSNNDFSAVAFFFLIVGAFAKSAQFFFHTWLPDAMEGPTPVSALLHSATMVTAGVFLTLRFMDLLELYPFCRYFLVFFGLITAFYAMSIAAVADDTKRVTAYTTLNQLGFMFFGCGSLAFSTVLFHLIVHGFYKSFSFLSAAMELHDFEDEQDGEFDQLDVATTNSYYDLFTATVFFSINAVPFTSPSISKEFILLAGMEKMPDYFTYMISIILFSSYVDEGRDDNDADLAYAGYSDDLYSVSQTPNFILAGSFGLGALSIFSATFLEEFFLDMHASSAATDQFFWVDTKGSILILLPFISLLLSEFDSSAFAKISDFNKSTIFSRTDGRYQSVLLNAELWFYDELVSGASSAFYKFANFQTNFVLDKGFFESIFIVNSYSFVSYMRTFISSIYSVSLEKLIFFSFFLAMSAFFVSYELSLLCTFIFILEEYLFYLFFKKTEDFKS